MTSPISYPSSKKFRVDPLFPLKRWLDRLEVKSAAIAHLICRLIPCSCPFERDIKILGRTLLHIPPLCKLNPLYQEFVALRLKALTYLADGCGGDVEDYIC
ncbi:MAG: Mo-dependent nitrogenase C-terminal domain-containing protein [Cyanobacteria bacterium P01_G01_bin.49]